MRQAPISMVLRHARRLALAGIASLSAACCGVDAVQAQSSGGGAARKTDDMPQVSRAKPASPNAMINLINAMVEEKVLSEEKAALLIKQADDEAFMAREASKDAATKADEAAKAATAATAAASPPGTRRVSYVPEIVKRQMREDLRKEVMAQAQKENWASPGAYPEWAQRIRFSGDFRVRYDGSIFPKGNDNSGNLWNFNAINTGNPFDVAGSNFPPEQNVDQNRNRFRLRARIGMDANLFDGFNAGFRIATGENSSPVSTNQTVGASGGNFSKYALWLDRAWLKYQPWENLALQIGRFDNPFFSPIDLTWNKDLGFDGVALQARYEILPGLTPFLVAGAFPTFNTDFNFATNQPSKFASTDKYLLGAQTGFGWKPDADISVKLGAAFHDFTNLQGRLSDPCIVLTASDACSTDTLRPSFAQRGNTYMALRNIVSTAGNNFGTTLQYQYFGLASQFRDVVLTGQIDFAHFNPVHIVLDGEWVKNVAFNRNAIEQVAVSNRGPDVAPLTPGPFAGGDMAWYTRLTVGHRELRQLGDWSVHFGYKYVQSDAIVDAFTDSDFGLGGTNLKGYIVGGNLALSESVWMSARWLSANAIAGSPFAVDVVQVDINAKF